MEKGDDPCLKIRGLSVFTVLMYGLFLQMNEVARLEEEPRTSEYSGKREGSPRLVIGLHREGVPEPRVGGWGRRREAPNE